MLFEWMIPYGDVEMDILGQKKVTKSLYDGKLWLPDNMPYVILSVKSKDKCFLPIEYWGARYSYAINTETGIQFMSSDEDMEFDVPSVRRDNETGDVEYRFSN